MAAPGKVKIGNRSVGKGEPTFFIAEAGINHNGDLETAKELVRAAARSGADAVKFQTIQVGELLVKNEETAAVHEMFQKLELPFEAFQELDTLARSLHIIFLSTPFDLESLDFLLSLDMAAIKIASADLTYTPLLERAGKSGKPIILSTGMGTVEEIEEAVRVIQNAGESEIIILHATISHPAPLHSLNLNAIETLGHHFFHNVGYSDHTEDILIPSLALAKGAVLVEKHFTLDRKMEGPDHLHSIEPRELEQLIRQLRKTEEALGTDAKECYAIEKETRIQARRSLVLKRPLAKGEAVTSDNLACKRPGTGIPPEEMRRVIGKTAKQPISNDLPLSWDFFFEHKEEMKG